MAIKNKYSINNSEKIKSIPFDEFYSDMLKDVKALYDDISKEDIGVLPYSIFKIFYENGSRKEFEYLYFRRRAALCCCTLLYLIYGKQEYLIRLQDIIWAICDEYAWSVPAHFSTTSKLEYQQTYIDLFAAETGQALSEIYYLLGSSLDDLVKKRIKKEVKVRIFDSFEKNSFYWERVNNNWAAVCAGSVGMAYMYLAPERFPLVEERILEIMQNFLSGYGDDGVCTEGLSYWNYGFGYFLYFAQMLYEFSEGKKDILHTKKVQKIAEFQQKVFLKNDTVVSFSDAGRYGRYNVGRTHFLIKNFDGITVPGKQYRKSVTGDHCFRFATFIRDFLWSDSSLQLPESSDKGMKYYENAQWYINKKDKFSFAAKAGNNDEPHNHNDVGCFIIAGETGQLIADIGCGEYTKDYFLANTRYKYLCNSSLGHSVPIIDGMEQMPGEKSRGEIIRYDDGHFELYIKDAYDVRGLRNILRSFCINDNGIELTDVFDFSDNSTHSITERFISLTKPELDENDVKIAELTLKCISKPVVSEQVIKDHSAKDLTVYIIDYRVEGNKFTIRFEF